MSTSDEDESAGVDVGLLLRRGGVRALIGVGGTAVAWLGVNALLARLPTPAELGVFFLAQASAMIAATGARAGMTHAAVRLIAAAMGRGDGLAARAALRTTLLLGLLGGVVVSLALWLGGGRWLAYRVLGSSLLADFAGLLALWTLILTAQFLVAEALRAFHRIGAAVVLAPGATNILFFPVAAWMWFRSGVAPVEDVLPSLVATHATALVVAALLLWSVGRSLPKGGHASASGVMALAAPLLLSDLAFVISSRGDLWLVGSFESDAHVALYGAAAQLCLLISMSIKVVNSVIPPIIAELFVRGERVQLEGTLQYTATLASVPAIAGFLVFLIAGPQILEFIYGEFYRDAALVLVILAAGHVCHVVVGSVGLTLMMTKHEHATMRLSMLGAAIMVGGCLAGGAVAGIVGVAVATAASLVVTNISMWFVVRTQLRVSTHASLLRLRRQSP